MKKIINILAIGIWMASMLMLSCEPTALDKVDIGGAPDSSALSFTITPGDDAFHVVFKNTSSVTGIANWDFGNGVKKNGDEITVKYALKGTYTVKMTLYTKGGSAEISEDYEQTETDFSIFTDPFFTSLSGGVDAIDGKTWVVDSTNPGHFGVGPLDADNPSWWSADPLTKSGHYIYDDEFNFKIVDFLYAVDAKGYTHASHTGADKGIAAGYYGGPLWEDDYDEDVSVNDEMRESLNWMAEEVDGTYYITFSQDAAVLGYDDGQPRLYEVLEWNENYLYVRSADDDEYRYHKLIPKGYVKPVIEFDLDVNATANQNEYNVGLANVDVPDGWTINAINYDFGDGTSAETTDLEEDFAHTFMRKGSYTVKVVINASDETFTQSESVEIASNHPSYVEYLLDAMVMYNDFGETTVIGVDGQDCSVAVVDNPDKSIWPNRSNHCAFYTKTNQQWANAYAVLPGGYRFDLTLQPVFKILVYGTAGHQVLLKLENTDKGGNAWQTGTHDLIYTIQESNKWEIGEYDFTGVGAGWDWTGDIYTSDVTTDPNFNKNFYNVVRIMLNPGDDSEEFSFHFDDLAGPHVEGLK